MTRADAEAMAERLNAKPWPAGVHYEVAGTESQLALGEGDGPAFGGFYVRRVTARWARRGDAGPSAGA